MSTQKIPISHKRRILTAASYALVLVLAAGLFFSQRGNAQVAWRITTHANLSYVLLGLGAMAVSVGSTALVYVLLSPKRLAWPQTVLVQTAGLFVNKLLPAGSGALGINYLYLRTKKLDRVAAGTIVAANNLLGFLGHGLLFLAIYAIWHSEVHLPAGNHAALAQPWMLGVVLLAAVVVAVALRRYSAGIRTVLGRMRGTLNRPAALGLALVFSMCITLSYWACLGVVCLAIGLHISPLTVFLALTLSVFATSILPTPGGIGAAEAGVYAAFVAYGIPHERALAAAVLYRVITFWTPLLVGFVGFVVVQRRRLVV